MCVCVCGFEEFEIVGELGAVVGCVVCLVR